MSRGHELWAQILAYSALCFSPEADLLRAMLSQGYRVTIEHGRDGYRVSYENDERKAAGSAVAPFFLEAITDAVHDVIDLEGLMA